MAQLAAFAAVLVTLTLLVRWYLRLRAGDRTSAILARKGATSMLSSPARLVDSGREVPVVLSLDMSRLSYENGDMDASIDVRQIDEVEYGSDLVTGGIAHGAVLRLRSHGRAFEFILEADTAERWSRRLPPHRLDEAGSVQVV